MGLESILRLEAVQLKAKLGCSAGERRIPQRVRVTLAIRFPEPPPGCQTDRLEDTVCYARLAENLASTCRAKEYLLVEHLAAELMRGLRPLIPHGSRLEVELTKEDPPVPFTHQGVTFVLRDIAE